MVTQIKDERKKNMPLGPGESLKFLNLRLNRTQAFLVLSTIILTLCVISGGVLWGVWGWNRANINTEEDNVDHLQKKMRNVFRESFYVSVNGSDKNPGTEEKPWLTIKHAAQQLRIKKNVELHIGEGTFDVNSTDFMFSMVDIYGAFPVVADLNITATSGNLGYGRFRLNVTNTLVPGSLVNLPFSVNQVPVNPASMVVENGVDYVIIFGLPGGSSRLIADGGLVLDNTLSVIRVLHDDVGSPNLANGSSVYYQGLTLDLNSTTVVSQTPLDIGFSGCAFQCYGNSMQLTRGGNFFAIGSVFDECIVNTQNAVVRVSRSVFYGGRFDANGGTGELGTVYSTGRVNMDDTASYQITQMELDSQDSVAFRISDGSNVNLANSLINRDNGYPLLIDHSSAVLENLVIMTNVSSLQMLYIQHGSHVTLANIHFIRGPGGTNGITISASDSFLFFQGTDYLFKGKTTGLLVAERTDVKLLSGLFIGNQTINGGGSMDHMLVFRGGSIVDAEDITIELTNLTNSGVLIENSRATFEAGDILLETDTRVGIEIAGASQVELGAGLNLTINSSSAAVEYSPIYMRDSSQLILNGNSDLSNDAGTCVYATRSSTIIHGETASTTLFCGEREFQLRYLSSLIFVNGSTATLSVGTADNTTYGGLTNATSSLLGTPAISYTDGYGAGLEACSIVVTG